MSSLKKFLANHNSPPKKPRLNFRILLNIKAYLLIHWGQHQRKGPLPACLGPEPDSRMAGTHLTAWVTRLSSGLRLGLLLEKRMPVPQLLASVFLGEGTGRGSQAPAGGRPRPPGALVGASPVQEEAKERRSRPCAGTCATWQFMSCALNVMYTLVLEGEERRIARAQTATFPTRPARPRSPLTTQPRAAFSTLWKGQTVAPPSTGHPCAHPATSVRKKQAESMEPWHLESWGQILNCCVGQPWNHPMKPLIYANVAENASQCLYQPPGVETYRPAFDSYQYEGHQGAPGPSKWGQGAQGAEWEPAHLSSSSFSEGVALVVSLGWQRLPIWLMSSAGRERVYRTDAIRDSGATCSGRASTARLCGGERGVLGSGVAVVGRAVGARLGAAGAPSPVLADVHHAVHGVHVADLPVLLVRALLAARPPPRPPTLW